MQLCDGDTAFNVYGWDSNRFKKKRKLPIIFEALASSNTLSNEDKKRVQNYITNLLQQISAKSKKDMSPIIEQCIKPFYNDFGKKLAETYNVFTYRYWDWTDYLEDCLGKKKGGDKTEKAWGIAKTVKLSDVKIKMRDLKNFIEQFVNSF